MRKHITLLAAAVASVSVSWGASAARAQATASDTIAQPPINNAVAQPPVGGALVQPPVSGAVTQPAVSGAVNDQLFAAAAAVGDLAELSTSKLALQRAANPEVRRFAQHLITDHSQ